MDSPNVLDLNILFADFPLDLNVGPEAYRFRTSWNVGRHCNADFEVHILLSGSCEIEIGNQEISLTSANAVLIPPGVYHSLHHLSDNFEWFCFGFSSPRQEFSEFLLAQLPSATSFKLPPEAMTMCNLILLELDSTQTFRKDSLCALFTQLLVMIFRSVNLDFPQQVTSLSSTTWRTAIIDDFFSLTYGSFGTIDELATKLNLSRRQLNRVLSQKYGMGFREKMFQTRMEYAKNLLRTTDHNVAVIGVMVGYSNESSFYKAFQSYHHMTPCQYRQTQKQQKNTK